MTEKAGRDRAARRARWSKRRIRVVAWSAGIATFVVSGGALAMAPKPATAQARTHRPKQKQVRPVIERTIIRRVVIIDPPTAAAVPAAGGAPIVITQSAPAAAPAPAPAPVPAPTSTGGS